MRLSFIITCFSAVLVIGTVAASAATPWQNHGDILRTRILVAETSNGNSVQLAWEAELSEGWKTYWRSPGEAGLPVRIALGGTDQTLDYPYPERFELFGLETYGYAKRVVIPFHIHTRDTAQKVTGSFMVCKDVCIPFEGDYGKIGPIKDSSGIIDTLSIESWQPKVPINPVSNLENTTGLTIDTVSLVGPAGHQRVIVDVSSLRDLSAADMLGEVSDYFHFGSPSMKLLADGRKARFILSAMVGRLKPDLEGQKIRLTFHDGVSAIDQTFYLAY